ncbi:hypothetical protein XENOCAPTIV_025897, partial [Xenoophorus captivus]
ELQAMFKVKDIPAVVVLRPDGSVLSPNAVQDISHLGTDCFRNWQESAELVERTFMLNEDFDDPNLRSVTDPVRRLKYKTEDDKRKKRWWKLWNNKDQDELDTEQELVMRLQNRILMLFFASAESETCQQFAPTLHDFFKQLTDEFYVERSAQLVLLYIRCITQTFSTLLISPTLFLTCKVGLLP